MKRIVNRMIHVATRDGWVRQGHGGPGLKYSRADCSTPIQVKREEDKIPEI